MYLFFALLFAIFSSILASTKNRRAWVWFFIGLLLGPFGLLVVFFPEINNEQYNNQQTLTDDDKWNTLINYNETAKSCLEKLKPFGLAATNELKKAYLVINDASRLPVITEKIISEINDSSDETSVMEKHGIVFDEGKYYCHGYAYSKLSDAVNYAGLKESPH